jgi:hypothetical protein
MPLLPFYQRHDHGKLPASTLIFPYQKRGCGLSGKRMLSYHTTHIPEDVVASFPYKNGWLVTVKGEPIGSREERDPNILFWIENNRPPFLITPKLDGVFFNYNGHLHLIDNENYDFSLLWKVSFDGNVLTRKLQAALPADTYVYEVRGSALLLASCAGVVLFDGHKIRELFTCDRLASEFAPRE